MATINIIEKDINEANCEEFGKVTIGSNFRAGEYFLTVTRIFKVEGVRGTWIVLTDNRGGVYTTDTIENLSLSIARA